MGYLMTLGALAVVPWLSVLLAAEESNSRTQQRS